jgi:threonine dehydratase
MSLPLPTRADVLAAAPRIARFAIRTPLLESDRINDACGMRVLVKAECLQPRGAFKMRGAANRLLQLTPEERARGVVAFSSGNHAQAIAYVARALGIAATIVSPSDAPAVKLASVEADGARLVLYDRVRESREAIAAAIAAETGSVVVPAFDDAAVIAGQGTCGLEILEQAADMGARPDAVLVCTSGGGLAAGIALALDGAAHLVCVEPAGHDDMARSLAAGATVANEPGVRSICDALLTQAPGDLTLPILRAAGATAVTVSDADALAAMAVAVRTLRLVAEPGGAVALAAALRGLAPKGASCVAVTLSGGNVDPATLMRALDQAASPLEAGNL